MLGRSNWGVLMCCSSTTILRHALNSCHRMSMRLGLVHLIQKIVSYNGLTEGHWLIVIFGIDESLLYCILNCLLKSDFTN